MEVDEQLMSKVKKALAKSDQTLVFLDSAICPIRKIVGKSHRDQKMHAILKRLKKEGIVWYGGGYHAHMDGGFVYLSCFVLTDQYFNNKPGTQLQLFS